MKFRVAMETAYYIIENEMTHDCENPFEFIIQLK